MKSMLCIKFYQCSLHVLKSTNVYLIIIDHEICTKYFLLNIKNKNKLIRKNYNSNPTHFSLFMIILKNIYYTRVRSTLCKLNSA